MRHEPSLEPVAPPIGRSRQPLLLVVDDVEGNRQLVCRRLGASGYDLQAVDSGQAALDFMRSHRPDLVLLDWMMPGMSGLDVLRVIRRDWHQDPIPIIMLTARAETEAVVEALEAGADDYVTKPIDFSVLKARIETQLTRMRSRDQLRATNAALGEKATMRMLAFDELREELEREIATRREAEKARDEAISRLDNCGACSKLPLSPKLGAAPSPDRAANHARALETVQAIMRAADNGRPINPALVRSLHSLVASLGDV